MAPAGEREGTLNPSPGAFRPAGSLSVPEPPEKKAWDNPACWPMPVGLGPPGTSSSKAPSSREARLRLGSRVGNQSHGGPQSQRKALSQSVGTPTFGIYQAWLNSRYKAVGDQVEIRYQRQLFAELGTGSSSEVPSEQYLRKNHLRAFISSQRELDLEWSWHRGAKFDLGRSLGLLGALAERQDKEDRCFNAATIRPGAKREEAALVEPPWPKRKPLPIGRPPVLPRMEGSRHLHLHHQSMMCPRPNPSHELDHQRKTRFSMLARGGISNISRHWPCRLGGS